MADKSRISRAGSSPAELATPSPTQSPTQSPSPEEQERPPKLENGETREPQYCTENSTMAKCFVATSAAAATSVACLAYGGAILGSCADDETDLDRPSVHTFDTASSHPTAAQTIFEASVFVVNTVITLRIDSMMYVHAVSLRWALHDGGRLDVKSWAGPDDFRF